MLKTYSISFKLRNDLAIGKIYAICGLFLELVYMNKWTQEKDGTVDFMQPVYEKSPPDSYLFAFI